MRRRFLIAAAPDINVKFGGLRDRNFNKKFLNFLLKTEVEIINFVKNTALVYLFLVLYCQEALEVSLHILSPIPKIG